MAVSHSGAPNQESTIENDRVLVVEGYDDQYVLTAVADRLGLSLHIHQMLGKDSWTEKCNYWLGLQDSKAFTA
jgi:hypothetical protein